MKLELRSITSNVQPLIVLSVATLVWLILNASVFSVLFALLCGFLWLHFLETRRNVSRLRIERTISTERAFTDQEVLFHHSVASSKRLKVTLLGQIEVGSSLTYNLFERELFIGSEPMRIDVRTSFPTRGRKVLKDLFCYYEHPLGLFRIWARFNAAQEVLVLPRLMPLEFFPARLREPLPGRRSDFKLFEDPLRIKGLREYSNDPIKKIHWKASAKFGKLLVKEYENTAISRVFMFVDLNMAKEIFARNVWGQIRTGYEEEAVRAATAVLYWLSQGNDTINMTVVGKQVLEMDWTAQHGWVRAVETLALAEGSEDGPQLSDVLLSQVPKLTFTSTMVVLSMYLTDSILPVLLEARARCARVMVFLLPYGYRDPRYKAGRTYEMYPLDMVKLKEKAKLLEEEQIIVRIIRPNQTLQEVFYEIDEVR
ncbi:MAG: hypothetical protein XD58_0792 [Thermotoga sp. 50_1627]|uniref:DUF58 domain-containing protein n=1 Tax=Pseudothermotoga sp. TaxID=2033661 RepID=UPI00076CCEA6|nr:MAG: hypothetical protein XD45_1128 [Thermotoga sp. 50_64]KUK25170.1 MAG: hypothetical protein XD58_0792 [Thermotoga sp. 50_1627]MBC7116874.1 DUF58 domain-containing protein [Pseudothermotoga sp.]MDK2923649.1 hypothetical protein [Pseudothermotoga sp.]HBT39369.1 DUF58 domain-containing protein [Pseudothermotoga sp.]